MGEIVQLEAPDGHRFSGYAALPDAEPQGGIVVGMEMYGVNSYLRSVCDDLAQAGYVSLAPALFDRFSPGITHEYNDEGSRAGKELSRRTDHSKTMIDVGVAAGYLRARHPDLKVAIMGFCFGGTVTWLAACRSSFNAAIAYYGSNMCAYPDEVPNSPLSVMWAILIRPFRRMTSPPSRTAVPNRIGTSTRGRRTASTMRPALPDITKKLQRLHGNAHCRFWRNISAEKQKNPTPSKRRRVRCPRDKRRLRDQAQTSSQDPWVAALEYSVARFSKKFVCSMPLSISSIHGSGFRSRRKIGCRPSWVRRRSAM